MKPIYFSILLLLCITACKDKSETPKQVEPIKEEIIEIKTSFGNIYIWLNKKTVRHRENFLKLAGENFYDGTTFHRCQTNFVIQGGDPLTKDSIPGNDGTGGPGYLIDAEIDTSLYRHDYGAVGTARDNNPEKKSNGSQFYIVAQTNGAYGLDNNYTVFGKVLKGMDVVTTINKQPKNLTNNRPTTNIYMDVNILKKTHDEIISEYGFSQFDW